MTKQSKSCQKPKKENGQLLIKKLASELEKTKEQVAIIREQRNKALHERNKINTILAIIADGVVVLDNNLKIVVFNQMASQISGILAKEAMGKTCGEVLRFMHEQREVLSKEFISDVTRKGKEKRMEGVVYLARKDGIKIIITGSVAPYKDKDNRTKGFIIVFRDVTREREIDIMKTEFVSLASHQLRTPLTAIRWFVEELYNGELGALNDIQKDYLKQVLESNKRMVKLVNDLLDVSRLEAARIRIEPKPTDIEKLIKEVIKAHKPISGANNCELIIKKPAAKIPKIKIDPSLIREVLGNLISNSIKYSFNKGVKNSVIISLEARDLDVVISVKDFGMGIPEKFKNRIFQKFFRADNVAEIDTEGTGFGLYISKLIVEASGGKIWFESIEGQGSTFYFSLPLIGSRYREGDKGLISEEKYI